MEDIKSKYVLWGLDSNRIELFDDSKRISVQPIRETVMEDVTITFNENGSITMEGEQWQFGIDFEDEYPENFNYEIHPNYIKKTRFRKKDIVRSGWHRKLHNKHKKVMITDYVIVF